jgi:hypothetical protein
MQSKRLLINFSPPILKAIPHSYGRELGFYNRQKAQSACHSKQAFNFLRRKSLGKMRDGSGETLRYMSVLYLAAFLSFKRYNFRG